MRIVERGPVPPWRDAARAAVAGAVLAAPLAAVLAALRFPDWGMTVASFALVFAFFLPLALVFRVLLHGLFWYVERGRSTPSPFARWEFLVYSRPPIAFGALFAAAYAVLALVSGLSHGDWSP